jgi:hypothetical protein
MGGTGNNGPNELGLEAIGARVVNLLSPSNKVFSSEAVVPPAETSMPEK